MQSNIKDILLIDTCVWLDLARDTSNKAIIMTLKNLIESKSIKVLLPDIIKEEFSRNKSKIIDNSKKKISREIKNVKEIVSQYELSDNKSTILSSLTDINHKLPMLSDLISEQVELVWEIIESIDELEINDSDKIKSSDRALFKKAPFHNKKESMADSLIIELFFRNAEIGDKYNYHFITHNTNDFSSNIDKRIYHSDFENYFSIDNINYSTDLLSLIKSISPDILDDITFEYEWDEESRGFNEILDNINILTDKIWYDRHSVRANLIAEGKIKVVSKDAYDVMNHNQIIKYIWDGALKSAKHKEEIYPDELGPWSSFEWGMMNGKLSALRWVLGEDWDMLDT